MSSVKSYYSYNASRLPYVLQQMVSLQREQRWRSLGVADTVSLDARVLATLLERSFRYKKVPGERRNSEDGVFDGDKGRVRNDNIAAQGKGWVGCNFRPPISAGTQSELQSNDLNQWTGPMIKISCMELLIIHSSFLTEFRLQTDFCLSSTATGQHPSLDRSLSAHLDLLLVNCRLDVS